jgi:cyclase
MKKVIRRIENIRIIPRLDIKGPNVVKGVHLEGLRIVGKPDILAKKYYEQDADELLYMDIVASLYQRNNLTEIVKEASQHLFVPMTVGGGIRTLEDINKILRSGADKISINTAAIKNPDFIKKASRTFGSQCIVVSIEAKRMDDGSWEAYTDNGRERTGVDAIGWAKKVIDLGAGELLITSVDMEGTERGFDLELIAKITSFSPIPVIACGGAGSLGDIVKVIEEANVDAVALASILHYNKTTIGEIHSYLASKLKDSACQI